MNQYAPKPVASAPSSYTAEYRAAIDRTESLGLKAPARVLVRKNCIGINRTLPVLLDYFDEHTNEELHGQTLAINVALIPRLISATGVPFELTLGWIDIAKADLAARRGEDPAVHEREARGLAAARGAVSCLAHIPCVRDPGCDIRYEQWLGPEP